MNEAELADETQDRIAQAVFRALSPQQRAFAQTFSLVFHGQIEDWMTSPAGQSLVESICGDVLAGRLSTLPTTLEGYQGLRPYESNADFMGRSAAGVSRGSDGGESSTSIRAGSISKVLRGIVLLLGLIELVWIAGYLLTDFGGIIGVVVALVLFPITISVAPVYGVLVYGDWTGVIVFALGAVSMVGAAMLDPDSNG